MPSGIRFPDLARWLDWRQSLHPQLIDLGLERVSRVLSRTGWRRPACPVVTVAGTNGKGSCVALLASILRAGGYRVGAFTSPHLVDYRERIRVDGEKVSEASLVAAFERIAAALDPDSLTFFEFNTLAALLVFDTAAPDAIVLEVGHGRAARRRQPRGCGRGGPGLRRSRPHGVARADIEAIRTQEGRDPARQASRGRRGSRADVRRGVGAGRGRRPAHLRPDFDGSENADGSWDYRDATGVLPGLPALVLVEACR
jgi:dihydrofolate synthase/folylpolyglutamate synthase